jgi:hypothetical protein
MHREVAPLQPPEELELLAEGQRPNHLVRQEGGSPSEP